MRNYFTYILSNQRGVLYTGVTNDLFRRAADHKQFKGSLFTNKYGIARLLYAEEFQYVYDALAREKQIIGWSRKKKLDLVKSNNPRFVDLAETILEWNEHAEDSSLARNDKK